MKNEPKPEKCEKSKSCKNLSHLQPESSLSVGPHWIPNSGNESGIYMEWGLQLSDIEMFCSLLKKRQDMIKYLKHLIYMTLLIVIKNERRISYIMCIILMFWEVINWNKINPRIDPCGTPYIYIYTVYIFTFLFLRYVIGDSGGNVFQTTSQRAMRPLKTSTFQINCQFGEQKKKEIDINLSYGWIYQFLSMFDFEWQTLCFQVTTLEMFDSPSSICG